MPRKQKKYHFIYKTTNLVNNKFYVGMHSTDNLDDGYFGSGKKHSEETKQRLRKSKNVGDLNPQFGTCWICSETENRAIKINKDELQSWLTNGWRKGRK